MVLLFLVIVAFGCVKNEMPVTCNPDTTIPRHHLGESEIIKNDEIYSMNAFFQEFEDKFNLIFHNPSPDSCFNEFQVDMLHLDINFEVGDSIILNEGSSFIVAGDWFDFDILAHTYILDSTKVRWLYFSSINLDSTVKKRKFCT